MGLSDDSGILIFLFAILIGMIPAVIAKRKGRSFIGWWIFGACFFIIALPCSLFASNKRLTLTNGTFVDSES